MDKDKFYIVGNWKSNKTVAEAAAWMQEFTALWKNNQFNTQKLKIIICPADIHLTTLKSLITASQIPLSLGLQDVSAYDIGAYTGELNASMAKDLVEYTLIGHSERRKYFQENEELLNRKYDQAQKSGIKSIFCVQEENQVFPQTAEFIAYEPIWAIGTGKPDTSQNANRVAKILKSKSANKIKVIYGGSVTPENVATYAGESDIDGVLPGGASLKADTFYRLIQNASNT